MSDEDRSAVTEGSEGRLDDPVTLTEEDSERKEEGPEDGEEPLDPRVQIELETLNCAAESINKLENELQKARVKFRLLKAESTQRLGALYKKIGRKWVSKARPYYDLLRQSHKAQIEAQKSTIKYRQANSVYLAAKETVTLAEQQLMTEGGEKLAFDSAWQEMLNHATMRFMEAEKDKRVTDQEHEKNASEYNSIQLGLSQLQKDMSRTITKSKPFYDLKDKLESRLQAERQNAEDLHLALICSKQKYKMALASLEFISEDVHSSRMQRRRHHLEFPTPRRTPGVGAESDTWSEVSELPSINLDFMSETASQASFEDFSDLDLDLGDWDDPPNSPPATSDFSAEGVESNSPLPFWSRIGSNLGIKSSSPALGTSTGLVAAAAIVPQRNSSTPALTQQMSVDSRGSASSDGSHSASGVRPDAGIPWVRVSDFSAGGPGIMVRDDLVDGAEDSPSPLENKVIGATRQRVSPSKQRRSFGSSATPARDPARFSTGSKPPTGSTQHRADALQRQGGAGSGTAKGWGSAGAPIGGGMTPDVSQQGKTVNKTLLHSVHSTPNLSSAQTEMEMDDFHRGELVSGVQVIGTIAVDKDAVSITTNTVSVDKDAVSVDIDKVSVGEETELSEKGHALISKDTVLVCTDAVSEANTAVSVDKVAVSVDNEKVSVDHDTVLVDKDMVFINKDTIFMHTDTASVETDVVSVGKDTVSVAKDTTSVPKDTVLVETDAVSVCKDTAFISAATEELVSPQGDRLHEGGVLSSIDNTSL